MKPSITVEKKEEILAKPIEKANISDAPKIKPETETTTAKPVNVNKSKSDIKQAGDFGNTVKKAFKAVVDFSNRHPVLTGIVRAVGVAGLAAAADAVANGGRSSSNNRSSDDYTYTPSQSNLYNDSYDEVQAETIDTDTSVERSSPKEHTVRHHGQHYIKNGERVWIEKDSYPRGGKKNE